MPKRHLLFAVAVVLSMSACGDDGSSAADGAPDATPIPDAAVPDSSVRGVPRADVVACRFTVPAGLGKTEGTDYECGDLIVYENRDQPTATIKVHFIRFFSPSASNNATIYLDGGPGGNGNNILAYAAYLGSTFLDGLMVDGDFMVIAQRGTSLSEPALLCSDPGCSDMPGAHLPSYNTAFNADDVDDLRATLGYDKLNLYGISYGSRLGLEVMRRHGEHIRASIIGGLVPAQLNWPANTPASFYSALSALKASCTADAGCSAAFGDLETKFLTAFNSLNDTELSWTYMGNPISMTGYDLAYILFRVLYSKSTYPWLPMTISDLAERRTDRVGDFLGDMLTNFGGSDDLSTGLYYSVVCNELFNPPDENAFDDANGSIPSIYVDIFGGNWYGMLDYCTNSYPLGPQRPTLSQAVTSDVRTFVANGAMDPITPPTFGDLAASTLSNAVVVLYANSGHGATLQSACGNSTFLSFLADPASTPDTSCAASVTTEYILPGAAALFSLAPNRAAIRFELSHAPPLPPFMRERLKRFGKAQ